MRRSKLNAADAPASRRIFFCRLAVTVALVTSLQVVVFAACAQAACADDSPSASFSATSGSRRVLIEKDSDGKVVVSQMPSEPWVADAAVHEKNPAMSYTAAFATFFVMLGAGLKAVDNWKETHAYID